jgi:hypothetical protein
MGLFAFKELPAAVAVHKGHNMELLVSWQGRRQRADPRFPHVRPMLSLVCPGTPRQMRSGSTNYGPVVGLRERPCIGSAYLSAFSAAVGGLYDLYPTA